MQILHHFQRVTTIVHPDIVVIVENGTVREILTSTRNQMAAVIDLDMEDENDLEDYESVKDDPEYTTIYPLLC